VIVEIRLFAGLAKHVKEQKNGEPFTIGLNQGVTVRELLHLLKIPEQEAFVTLVNGTAVSKTTKLSDGDRIGIFPAIGGG